MLKKIISFTPLILFVLLFINFTSKIAENNKPLKYNIVSHSGEVVGSLPGTENHAPAVSWDSPSKTIYEYDNPNTITITTQEVNTNARTTYDYQSNGAIRFLAQDPVNPQYLHAVFMVDPVGSSGFPDRKTKYYLSTDMGTNWFSAGNITAVKSGSPSIDILSDEREIVAVHTTDGGFSSNIAQVYVDVAPGAGSFTRLSPASLNVGDQPEFAKIIATSNITHTNKFLILASEQTSRQAFTNIGTSLSTGAYLGWAAKPNIGFAEAYALSRGSDGRIGIVYGNNDQNSPGTIGNVYFMQSTDEGLTYSTPNTIWSANFNTDSLGCVRSLDLCYTSNIPNAVFAVCQVDPVGGGYFPASLSKILFWSPSINSGNPITIDTCSMMRGSNPQNDVFYSDCRPVIGRSSDNSVLYVAWCRSRPEYDGSENNYFDIYFSFSTNGGLNWHSKIKVTNNSGPLRDCRYVSISQSNAIVGNLHYAHLIYQMDSIPGSFVNGAQMSFARMMYAKISIDTLVLIGNHNINYEIPKEYSLYQDYPNPFNPATKIRFDLPKNEFVSLNIYDITGKTVSILINEKLSAGIKEYDWNAADMPSGVYFYTIKAGDFTQTKKMVLIK